MKDFSSTSSFHHSNQNYGQFSTGGNLHQTFQVDRYGNPYKGHVTIDLGNNVKDHIYW